MKIDYTLWPNADGELGKNKVQIPDGVTVQWPHGDALVGNFVYDDGLISGFVDTKALVVNDSKTSTIPYDYVNIHLDSIIEGDMNVVGGERTKYLTVTYRSANSGNTIVLGLKYVNCKTVEEVESIESNYKGVDIKEGNWTESLKSLENGKSMFEDCVELVSFNSDLSYLTEGVNMFRDCSSLTTFDADLSSLTSGGAMFYYCNKMETFNCKSLSSLKDGDNMFERCVKLKSFNYKDLNSLGSAIWMFYYCSNLSSFEASLSSLYIADSMFAHCSKLESFKGDLSSLGSASQMFSACGNLTSFESNLSSLVSAQDMFSSCNLDSISVANILNTINSASTSVGQMPKIITLGFGCDNNTEDKNLFAQEVGYSDIDALTTALTNKKWNYKIQYNGRPTSTYNLRRTSSLPVFVKIEEQEDGNYVSMEGDKKYKLDYFHDTNDLIDGYTQFNSLEEAIEHFNIFSVES